MTSIAIQLIRLIAPFTSLEKVVNKIGRLSVKKNSAELIVYNTLKQIVSLWQDFIDCVRDPQLTTGCAHGMTVLRNTGKNIVFLFNRALTFTTFPKYLTLQQWHDKKMSNLLATLQKILNCPLHSNLTFDFNPTHNTYECLTKRLQIQDCQETL